MPPAYQPASRRPIADKFRATAHLAASICVRLGIHPDLISWTSVAVAAGAAVCFWQASAHPYLLLAGSGLCLVRLWLNMLDGMVAIAAGQASLRGEIFNDFPDRISDALIFAGVAHSGLCAVASGYWTAIMALLTAYVGITGQAVAGKREYGGIMSKPWRMAVLCAGAVITFAILSWQKEILWGALTVLDWTCVVIILGCLQTMAVRLRKILRNLAIPDGAQRSATGESPVSPSSRRKKSKRWLNRKRLRQPK